MEHGDIKDFDGWNTQKKMLHKSGVGKYYAQKEIWWCSLGVNIGFEEDGSGSVGERPVLIVRGFSRHICLIVPLTTAKKDNPFYFALGEIGGKPSFAIISQIKLIDTKRLINKIGAIDGKSFLRIRKAIRDLL